LETDIKYPRAMCCLCHSACTR